MISRRQWLTSIGSAALSSFSPLSRAVEGRRGTTDVEFLEAGAAGYDFSRALYNSRLDLRPRIAARCMNEVGVQEAVGRAASLGLPVSIKSGGHSLAGFSVVDDSLLVDVGLLKSPELDANGILTVGPGLRLAELNSFLLPRGRLLPAGSCGGVAVGGLALGGGYGFFSREHGMTCDHLSAIRLVDSSGKASEYSGNSQVLRACRGGGNGNFGVVTRMQFSTVPAPRSFSIVRQRFAPASVASAVALVERWFELCDSLPSHCYSAWVANGKAVTVLITSTRSLSRDLGVARLLSDFGKGALRIEPAVEEPTASAVKRFYGQPGPLPFHNASAGLYGKARDFLHIAPDILGRVRSHPGLIFQLNTFGPFPKAPPGAFVHRNARWIGEVQAYWANTDPPARILNLEKQVEAIIALVDQYGNSMHYANYADPAIRNPLQSYYGSALSDLQAVKKLLDPGNLFRHLQSVNLPD